MKFTKKLHKVFSSGRLAVWLIAAFLILAILSQIVPQKTGLTVREYNVLISEKSPFNYFCGITGLDNVYSSYPFIALVTLLYINLAVCMVNRLVSIFKVSFEKDLGVFFSVKAVSRSGVP